MKLFEPGYIGKLRIKNRIVMAPMFAMGMADKTPQMGLSQRGIDYYVARAKGGTGLIISGICCPNEKMEKSWGYPLIGDRGSIMWLSELAEAVHDYGAKMFIQYSAGFGRQAPPDPNLPYGGLVAPSPIPSFYDPSITCRELRIEEIEEFVHDFGVGAGCIADAGIDGIEIHAHQGYLLTEFLAPRTNKRTDKYGGDLDGRLRIIIELLQAIKKNTSDDYPVTFRYGLTDHLEGEIEGARGAEEGLEIARKMEAAGINGLHIDAGVYETNNWAQPPTTQPEGCLVYLAEMAKKAVNIPIIAVGKLGDPALAERVLQSGQADFVALGRPLLADPDWSNKVKAGRTEDVRPCIGCDEGCLGRLFAGKHLSCAVNPQTGNERNLAITPATTKNKVVIIGGGPGGMEAARVAALRGHDVTLLEKNFELGGNLIPAAIPDFKFEYRRLIDYFVTQLRKLGVNTKLGVKATPELVFSLNPDVVFVATGSTSCIPEIPGVDKDIAITAVDLLINKPSIGEEVVVIGGNIVGAEVALYLCRQGKKVTIVECLDEIMRDMLWINALDIQRRFDGLESDDINVKVMVNTEAVEVVDSGLVVVEKGCEQKTIKADKVVLAVGMIPQGSEMAEILAGKIDEVYTIGDCISPGKVIDAVWAGFRTARVI